MAELIAGDTIRYARSVSAHPFRDEENSLSLEACKAIEMTRRISRAELQAPTTVLNLNIDDMTLRLGSGDPFTGNSHRTVFCLVRSAGVPFELQFLDLERNQHVDPGDLAGQFLENRPHVNAEFEALPDAVVDGGFSVVLCTRERPDGLRRALRSLEAQSDTSFEVIVVDNAPTSDATKRAVLESHLPEVEYCLESRPGLSRARNKGLSHVDTSYVAWLDDDEIADPDWVLRTRQGFAHPSGPSAICGLMLPAELESEAQVRFEQYGGFNKGRGIEPEILQRDTPAVKSPLYPLPAFGAGGNMAFKTDALRRIRGFDECLGAGTRTHGGEDMLVLAQLLRRGEIVLHWPSAVTWHYHRREMEDLKKQLYGYCASLSAFYASLLRSQPSIAIDLLKLLPLVVREALPQKDSLRSGHLPEDYPSEILRSARKGFAEGAWLYVQEVRAQRDGIK
jgi:glycosyltransferase involved in cell wall biosynthesis